MKLLLLLAPVAILLEVFAPERHVLIFLAAGIAILPAAGMLGHATERLAERTGEGIGGLLNATFGNAAELILALAALRSGLHDIVKASIAGSIIGNILLVLGASMLAGGLRHHQQSYNATAAKSQATMLVLAAIALILPAAHRAASGGGTDHGAELSLCIAILLLVVYGLNLFFALVTHRELFAGPGGGEHAHADEGSPGGIRRPLLELLLATALIAWLSEIVVGVVQPASAELGLSQAFVGVFVIALLGNAAEHATAVTAAWKNRMDLSLSIAIGSSVQIALFVAPVLVLLSRFVGPAPMDLDFGGGLVLTVVLSVVITSQVASDGRSDWLRGVQLLGVYLVLAVVYLFLGSASAR